MAHRAPPPFLVLGVTVLILASAPGATALLALPTTALDADPGDALRVVAVGYASPADGEAAAAAVGGALVRDLAGPRVAFVAVTEPVATLEARAAASPGVRYVEASRPLVLEDVADPLARAQWALDAVNLPRAWRAEPGNDEVVIALLDSGVDVTHADLAPHVWRNSGESVNGRDDDGNGYVDDVHGHDFCTSLAVNGSALGVHVGTPTVNPGPVDAYHHGTGVAGVASAVRGNGIGIAGASAAAFMPLKIFHGAVGCGSSVTAAAAITYAADNGARVISMSWSVAPSRAVEDALAYAWERDALLVKSAGNAYGGPVSWPGPLPFVLAVAGTHADGGAAPFSSAGSAVGLAAPAENVMTTAPGNAYAVFSGTSFAAPLVAGVATLVMSACPSMDAAAVWATLNATARDRGAPGDDPVFGHGVVDAHAAVTRCASAPSSPPLMPPAAPGDHPPVRIDGDDGFCGGMSTGVVNCATADGSKERPFRIAGWTFTLPADAVGAAAVDVRNTTAHFVVERNVFRDLNAWDGTDRDTIQAGVRLVNVTADTAEVRDNRFTNVGVGVLLRDAGVRVHHNTMVDVWKYFVWVDGFRAGEPPVIERNVFRDSHGMVLVSWIASTLEGEGTNVRVRFNNFHGNVGVNTAEVAGHDATLNWWGDARGPDKAGLEWFYRMHYRGLPWEEAGHSLRDATDGDQVLHAHNLAPWLTEPVADAGARSAPAAE